ncbi:MAG TPA: BTAD domain-containing putative transcriptional regulator [Acidothermaceae bacterium]
MGADVGTLQTCGVTSPPSRYHAGITPLDRSGVSFDTRSVEIGVLGPVVVAGSDVRLGHRDRVILSALALEPGEVLSPDRLADALWGEAPPKSWPKVVQGSMMRLRRALGPHAIETTSTGYRLSVPDDDVDTVRFERLVSRARRFAAVREPARAVTTFELALSLWRGPPFPELEGWDAGRAEAARLTEVRRSTEEELVEARLAAGRPVEAVPEARRLAAREPYREHRWALLAVALYRSGRQREALDVIRGAASTLRDELGLDPGRELADLEQAVLQQDPVLLMVPDTFAGTGGLCPYKGLRPYGVDDADAFFGRDEAVAGCLARLVDSPLLVVVGPSGSGKSSLVAAGLVPALRMAGRRVVQLSPGTQPLATLTAAMASEPSGLAVVIDQLEELFTASGTEVDAEPFLSRLVAHAETGALVLVTLRADYVAELAVCPAFARLAERGLMLLTPMTEAELERAIEAPAAGDGLLLAPGLVDLLVRDVLGEPGGLPLLSHALAETWERREGRVLTVEGYTQTGGIRAAVAQSAERLYDSLPAPDRAALRTVMLRLVSPTPSGDPIGARVPARVFAGDGETARLLDVLVRARLVTTDAETVAIAHESLTRVWPRLRSWLDEDVEGQRIFQHLQVAADGWNALGRPEGELYRGARLQAALEWRERVGPVLANAEIAFLAASETREDDERRHQDRALRQQISRNRQLRAALTAVIGLLVLALVAGTVAAVSSRHARAAATGAEAARLVAAAFVQPQADTALLLARQAVALAATPTTEGGLLEALGRDRGLVGVVDPAAPGFGGGNLASDDLVSPDGTRVLINGGNGVDLIDTSTGQFVGGRPLEPQPADLGAWPFPVGFTDGGRTALVSVQTSSTVPSRSIQAFNASDGQPIGAPQLVPDSVSAYYTEMDRLRISPDGRTLVSVLDRSVRMWKRSTRTSAWGAPFQFALPLLPPSLPEEDLLLSATFSTDGSRAALLLSLEEPGQPSNVGIVVDTDAAQLLGPLVIPQPNATPEAMTISPAGDRLAIGYQDGSVELRAVSGAAAVVRIPGTSLATALGWTANGASLVVGHDDGSLFVFNTNPLHSVVSYPAGGHGVQLAALRGDRLISQDFSQAITVRSLADTNGLMRETPIDSANSIAAGPPGSLVAVGETAGKVALYSQKTLLALPLHLSLGPYAEPDTTAAPNEHERVSALAITPDGSGLIAADRLGHLRMWSLPDGRLLWLRDDVPTSFLAISPNGRYLATSGFTQDQNDQDPDVYPIPTSTSLTVWDLATKQPVLIDNLPRVAGNDSATPKPRAVVFSPDSKLLAAAFFEETLVFANFADHARQVVITPQSAPNNSAIVFSPDGKELFIQDSNGKVTGFDPQTGRSIATFPAPARGYSHLLFTVDGKWLVGSDTTAIYVWDGRTSQLVVSKLSLPSNGASDDVELATTDALAIAATDDRRLFVGTQTSLVAIDMDPSTWESQACSMAGRTLTRAEWSQFLPGRAYAPACR